MALPLNMRMHFTGSRSEGLNLLDSDEDYMIDINDAGDIEVVQSFDNSSYAPDVNSFYLCTEHTHPGFALLRCVDIRVPNPVLLNVLQLSIYNHLYLSSNLVAETYEKFMKKSGLEFAVNSSSRRQGPSLESWHDAESKSVSGSDYVPSIHCKFWPKIASEWEKRKRQYGWPTSSDIASIVAFGCHLVPIGYPHSDMKLMEWRLSFSIAERTLVWSFNHAQMQCYAVMKIILNEYIKKHCSKENQILCSYFIKTFLFWIFETTKETFWRIENISECIRYLLLDFFQCLREGILRHYFIPEFNLLSVKLTPQAQCELLHIYENIIQQDISIMKECGTLKMVWANCLQSDKNQMKFLNNAKRTDLLKTDKILINDLKQLYHNAFADYFDTVITLINMFVANKQSLYSIMPCLFNPFDYLIRAVEDVPAETCLKPMFIKRLITEKYIRSLLVPDLGSEHFSRLLRIVHYNNSSFDISTFKIWCAIIFVMKRDYKTALGVFDDLKSCIPPFALCEPHVHISENPEVEILYAEEFANTHHDTVERARKAWKFNIEFIKSKSDALPLAIQIELYFSHVVFRRIRISPVICLYYLMFLCSRIEAV